MSDTLLATSGADPRIGMLLQDKYKIVRKLGEGGMGAVYEGEHTLIKRRVAIKCLHAHYASSPEIVARFHREALAATSIGHPNIIECTDMGRFPDGAFFMVLEFLDGRDWSHLLQSTGPQPLGRVVHIMMQVCDALTAAHDKGVVHRDLKPENIFLIKRGSDPDFVKVLDFGISKVKGAEGEAPSKGLTRTGTAMGTPYYMAPEQAQGKRDIDHRADIYALGVILFQALTGQYPFDDESYPMLVVKICTQDAPPIERYRPDLPPAIAQLVRSMLAKSPADRPQTCADVKAALEPYAGQNAAPVVARDAPPTAGLATAGLATAGLATGRIEAGRNEAGGITPGTFDGQPVPGAAQAAGSQGPATGPFAIGQGPGGPGGADRAQTPATRAGTATPFAAADTGPISRASLSEIAPARPKLALWIGLGGGAIGLAAIAAIGMVTMGGGTAPAQPIAPTAAAPAAETTPSAPTQVAAPAAATATPAAATTTPAIPAASVRVQISTTPADAQLFLDDDRIPNPFDADLPQTREPRTLRAEREGYVTYVQDLVLSFPQRVVVPLRRGRGVQDTSTRGRAAGASVERAGSATPATARGEARGTSAARASSEARAEGTAASPAPPTAAAEPPRTTVAVEVPAPRPEPAPETRPATSTGGAEAQPAAGARGGCPSGLLDPFGRCRRTAP